MKRLMEAFTAEHCARSAVDELLVAAVVLAGLICVVVMALCIGHLFAWARNSK